MMQIFSGLVGFLAMWVGSILFYWRGGALVPIVCGTVVSVLIHERWLTRGSNFFFDISFPANPLEGVINTLVTTNYH